MVAKRGFKVFRRKSLSHVNTDGSGGRVRKKLAIQARLVFDQSVMRNIQFLAPGHFNNETRTIKACFQRPLSSGPIQLDEGGHVELVQRHELATFE